MKHDIEIEEFHPDEQSTVWFMSCKRCGKRSKPLMHKDDARKAIEENSCPGFKRDLEAKEINCKSMN